MALIKGQGTVPLRVGLNAMPGKYSWQNEIDMSLFYRELNQNEDLVY